MTRRAVSFGAIAEAYERFRPGYPPVLLDRVMAYAGHPVRTALEIGAGTGKATRLFTVLPPAQREELFRRIGRVLPEVVEMEADITLHLARRRHEP
ncbi:hypothetical protein [Streptomyces sp. NPDC059173]|uniref:hypothetical protein n=1 Tax=unclassified Streptomyces TaxID=2593676 RepID=UPI0036B44681